MVGSSVSPEWCKSGDTSALTETIKYTRCYLYNGDQNGSRKYLFLNVGLTQKTSRLDEVKMTIVKRLGKS